jgi:hypothetical protein
MRFLKLKEIKKYKIFLVKTVFVKKKINQFKLIEIFTIKDKVIQMLFSFILNAYLKTFKFLNLFYYNQKCHFLKNKTINSTIINNSNKYKTILQKINVFGNNYIILKKKLQIKHEISLLLFINVLKKCFYDMDQK